MKRITILLMLFALLLTGCSDEITVDEEYVFRGAVTKPIPIWVHFTLTAAQRRVVMLSADTLRIRGFPCRFATSPTAPTTSIPLPTAMHLQISRKECFPQTAGCILWKLTVRPII